jgi:putative membrane protein
MNIYPILKARLFALSIILVTFTIGACENTKTSEAKTEDSSEVAAKENDAKFENKKQENDAQFLVDATTISLEEIKLAELAKRSNVKEVRELGKMMAEAHTKALKEARDLAKTKQVTVPDSATTATVDFYKTLSEKSGNDFNKAYCDRMVEGHKDAIGKFEKETAESRDQDIKEWAANMLPDLRKHLDAVFAVQKKFDKI